MCLCMSLSRPATLLECSSRADLARLLDVDYSTLNYYAYGTGKKYKHFLINKKSGGYRQISAPIGGLNNIQKKLSRELETIYKPHAAAQGFIKTRSILTNALPHVNKKAVLNIDLENFFPSITATRIIGLLKSKPFNLSNQVASAVAALATYDNKMPQGAATSPVLSNMICYRLDRQLTDISKKLRLTYTRYADDMSFSTTRPKFSEIIIKEIPNVGVSLSEYLVDVVNSNNFSINFKKVRLHHGTEAKFVTGVKVNLKPNVRKSYVRELRGMIHSWEKHGLEAAQIYFDTKYGGAGRPLKSVILGKLGHLKQIKGRDDLVYRRLHNRVMIQMSKYDEILPVDEIEDLMNRIFVIKSGQDYGTGFILDNKWLITCAHVVTKDEITFFNYKDALVSSKHYISNKNINTFSPLNEYDIAALPINPEMLTDLNVLFSAEPSHVVKIGDKGRVLGFPEYYSGATPAITDIKVKKVQTNKYGILDAYVDQTLVAGNSGGPVIGLDNKVIGVVRTGAVDASNIQGFGSTFLPIQELRTCLSQFDSNVD